MGECPEPDSHYVTETTDGPLWNWQQLNDMYRSGWCFVQSFVLGGTVVHVYEHNFHA